MQVFGFTKIFQIHAAVCLAELFDMKANSGQNLRAVFRHSLPSGRQVGRLRRKARSRQPACREPTNYLPILRLRFY